MKVLATIKRLQRFNDLGFNINSSRLFLQLLWSRRFFARNFILGIYVKRVVKSTTTPHHQRMAENSHSLKDEKLNSKPVVPNLFLLQVEKKKTHLPLYLGRYLLPFSIEILV